METKIPLREIMVQEVVQGDLDLTVQEAAKLMRNYDVDSLVVLRHGEPIGIVTEGDIIRDLVSKDRKPSTVKIKDIMTFPLITASPDNSLSDGAKMMVRAGIRKIPVLENGKLVGIVADTDIITVSSELNSILTDLRDLEMERAPLDMAGDSPGQGICEKCGSFSHYLEMEDGLMVCDMCKEEMEIETGY